MMQNVKLRNFLSFGSGALATSPGPLELIIGPKGSGKYNFLEAFELPRHAPEQLLKPIRESRGIRFWLLSLRELLWKNNVA